MFNSNAEFWTQVDNEESYTDLVMAIEFSSRDRVSLFIAVCDVDRVQQDIINRYTEQLSPEFQANLLSIDRKHLNPRGLIFELEDNQSRQQSEKRVLVSIVGATGLSAVKLDPEADKSDRSIFFGYLQWTRESFRRCHFPIVFWVSKDIYDLMLSEAPDFWSWRKSVFFFKSDMIDLTHKSIYSNLAQQQDDDILIQEEGDLSITDLEKLVEQISQRSSKNPLLITLYNKLGKSYFRKLITGESIDSLDEKFAISYFQKAISITRDQNRHPNKDLAISLSNLGDLYKYQSFWMEAEPLYFEALSIYRQLFGDYGHHELASILNKLANLYQLQGRSQEAQPLYIESLSIYRQLFEDSPNRDLANSLNNLANLYQSQGQWAEAEVLHLQVLQIYRLLSGGLPDNNLATSLNNLANLYQSQGRWQEAEPLYLESLKLRLQVSGDRVSKDLANSLNNLASLYQLQGRLSEAASLYSEASGDSKLN